MSLAGSHRRLRCTAHYTHKITKCHFTDGTPEAALLQSALLGSGKLNIKLGIWRGLNKGTPKFLLFQLHAWKLGLLRRRGYSWWIFFCSHTDDGYVDGEVSLEKRRSEFFYGLVEARRWRKSVSNSPSSLTLNYRTFVSGKNAKPMSWQEWHPPLAHIGMESRWFFIVVLHSSTGPIYLACFCAITRPLNPRVRVECRRSTELHALSNFHLVAIVGVLTWHFSLGNYGVKLKILPDANCQMFYGGRCGQNSHTLSPPLSSLLQD